MQDLADLQTPALLVDLDAARHNVAHMLRAVGGDARRWRPHTKTSKIPEVLDLLLQAGVRRFKCATTREARVLLDLATDPIDLLIAMPHFGANLARCASLAREHARHRVSVLTEDPGHAREAKALGLLLFADVNPGMHRTGIPLGDHARLGATLAAAGDALGGIHFYEGHLRQQSRADRDTAARAAYGDLLAALRAAGAADLTRREIVTSGTPSFPCALEHEGLRQLDHTISPGTVVYFDTTSRDFGLEGFRQAVFVLTRVISHPGEGRATCDAGSKAIDAASGHPCCEVDAWPGLEAQVPSEEHLPLRVAAGARPALGTLLRLVPRHVCPTVNLAERAVLLESGHLRQVVAVAARGHDL